MMTGDSDKKGSTYSGSGLLLLEGIIIFIGLPGAEYVGISPLPKLVLLGLVAVYCGYVLWRDSMFGKGLFRRSEADQASKTILLRLLIIAPGLFGLAWILDPVNLLAFPIEDPWIWMLVMVLYPVFSALPQEIIYRTFFFHRYKDFFYFKNSDVLFSALAFSFLHLVYGNWMAIGLSFGGGILFGMTYKRTQSLFWVTVEHILYGWLIFTLGLGEYFFEGF
ncbi:CPBP family intramembrane metalloprotease [Aliifodinibius salipaludis]|uniref:CPBP family intramembrane metalloprotease n=1 Tax=Fodinibius salipaludis TaxID=2032627 RepID=A0A2A2GF03_9BACT|nr:CPBP family intramembrane glutamic endopeptidase [Aliifodinibius salipaludis]PAU95342.1 CPBP family intramembrane metalloprotease [Aliifodinibius salipaludis]